MFLEVYVAPGALRYVYGHDTSLMARFLEPSKQKPHSLDILYDTVVIRFIILIPNVST